MASVQHVVLSLLHEEQAKDHTTLRYVYLQFNKVDLCTYYNSNVRNDPFSHLRSHIIFYVSSLNREKDYSVCVHASPVLFR